MAELHTEDKFMYHNCRDAKQASWENQLLDDYETPKHKSIVETDPLVYRITHQRGPKVPARVQPSFDYSNEINWSLAPSWANYWAMDDDGAAFWYENKPTCDEIDGAWNDFSDWSDDPAEDGTRLEDAPRFRKDPALWKESLVSRNKNLNKTVDLTKPLSQQIGGDHYRQGSIQPIEYIHANNMDFFSGNVVKYITRWKYKNGLEDLKKAKHYIELLIEQEYGNE